MSDVWILVLGMALVTFLSRYPVLVILGRMPLPAPILNALQYVPVAVLTAICVPMIFRPGGEWFLDPTSPYLAGGLATVLVAWYYRQLLLTLLVGMSVFFLWKWLWYV